MNCVFVCVFTQTQFLDMLYLLLESIQKYGKLDDNTHILIYTSTLFMNMIKSHSLYNNNIKFEVNDTMNTIEKACRARLDLFKLDLIKNYDKVLYLDTDILIKGDLNIVFNICEEDLLYVLEEGAIDSTTDFWGYSLFTNAERNNYSDKSAFTSGIMLFKNCSKIRALFEQINECINTLKRAFVCHDQPYIVYNAFKYHIYNNKILKDYVVNNDHNINSDKIIHHFPGGPGSYHHKLHYMNAFIGALNAAKLK
jgi:lipopolysaccharide biosynthesis glycosyltransferase